MDYLDKYVQRLERKGQNAVEATINSTKVSVTKTFKSSPSISVVKINNVDVDVIVNNEEKDNEKLIFFMPDYDVNIGTVVEYKGSKYLILEFFDNAAYPKGKMKLCNTSFSLSGTSTKTQVGENSFGEPLYEYVESAPTLLPCIAETTITSDNVNEAINLPEGIIQITIPYTEHADLVEGKEFTMYGTTYQIIGIDYTKSINGVGLLVIKGKKV